MAVCQWDLQIRPSQHSNLIVFKVRLLKLCAFVDKSAAIMAVSSFADWQMGFNPGCLGFLITHRSCFCDWVPYPEPTYTLRCSALKAVYIWAVMGSASNSLCQSHSEDQRVVWVQDQYIPLRFFCFFFNLNFLYGSEWSERRIGLIYPSVRLSLAFYLFIFKTY